MNDIEKVILFRTENICPKCIVLKEKLKDNNIQFEESTDIKEVLDAGFRSAPVLKVGDTYMSFKDANEWIKKI